MRHFRHDRFPKLTRGTKVTRGSNQNEVPIVWENKKNGRKIGERTGIKDHRRYCQFHDTTRHDNIKCTMLYCDLENRMQSGQLTEMIKGLRSKHMEIIAPAKEKKK